ncbi:nucleoside triphosphate pyrophosphohydrolase [Mangrovibacillus cuniculi]|uniref:Nucleoside triphosphate pyrophosphohydrolase n=1 Tax=Mangrovibacillus cuniculi TaxID=2593652 RepID=A0A7S8C8W5_9BACI|nr:nucleoside triphosphate pyrophosphohydrolase [Mangrovibacillus cuniculi]QPC45570.1 nucleoside triphosphate pyrophosphohydrolase [Mangrovibacillus cuniculi]
MPTYNKLVRDRIPKIIEASEKAYTTRILSEEEYIDALQTKCLEEFEEYRKAESNQEAMEELADLLEVMNALCKVHGASLKEVDDLRKAKAARRGGFEERIFLMEVEDDES